MPRLLEAKKDVTSCEKPGLGANNRMTPGSPNGATHHSDVVSLTKGSKRRELKHLSTCRKRKQKVIAQVVASERAEAQTNTV